MVCLPDFCAYCITGMANTTYEDLDKGPIQDYVKFLQGKPAVHSTDCSTPNTNAVDTIMRFKGSNRPYDSENPLAARMFTPPVIFTVRNKEKKKVRAVMC